MFRRLCSICLLTTAFIPFVVSPAAAAGVFRIVSQAADGDNFYIYEAPSISADGRRIAFAGARQPADGSAWGLAEIYVRDHSTGELIVASVGTGGTPSNDSSWGPLISSDGRFVSFFSLASNLVANDTDGAADLFISDLTTHATIQIQPPSPGDLITSRAISADARIVAYSARHPGSEFSDRHEEIYIYDRSTGATTHVPLTSIPEGYVRFGTSVASVSGDGRFVVFFTARPLTANDEPDDLPGDTNLDADVFVLDRSTSTIERISVSSTGQEGLGSSWGGDISDDGRYVVFMSEAAGLVADDPVWGYGSWDVFLRDRVAGTTTRVSHDRSASEPNSQSVGGSISSDGRTVAYQSQAILDSAPADIFLYDVQRARAERLAIDANSHENDYLGAMLSADGRLVSFVTAAALVQADSDPQHDAYVYDRGPELRPDALLRLLAERLRTARGWKTGVYAKVRAALKAVDQGRVPAACGPLNAALNQTRRRDPALAVELRDARIALNCGVR